MQPKLSHETITSRKFVARYHRRNEDDLFERHDLADLNGYQSTETLTDKNIVCTGDLQCNLRSVVFDRIVGSGSDPLNEYDLVISEVEILKQSFVGAQARQ